MDKKRFWIKIVKAVLWVLFSKPKKEKVNQVNKN